VVRTTGSKSKRRPAKRRSSTVVLDDPPGEIPAPGEIAPALDQN
jgi:hypothetical protein